MAQDRMARENGKRSVVLSWYFERNGRKPTTLNWSKRDLLIQLDDSEQMLVILSSSSSRNVSTLRFELFIIAPQLQKRGSRFHQVRPTKVAGDWTGRNLNVWD